MSPVIEATKLYQGLVSAPDPGRPVVFAFHGTGGNEHQFAGLARQLVPGGGVISPRGDVSEHGAARFFRRTGEGVYDMEDLARRTTQMIAFVEAHRAAYPDSPVYGFGYSNGANILASVVLQRPDLFDRVGLLHPLIPWTPEPVPAMSGKPVLITAGRRDPITPWTMSAELVSWFEAQGAVVTTVVHEGGHELREEEIAALAQLLS
ncbi:alpha/beta hydrolase [Cognatishimia sp. F0-27]|uniref:alpha/beta hydrolase n=1 Tax=Cognatishimia sp. F0-27 TaxID=2816855 RepID=UPI001D0C95E0|nr:alpha/beta hydrolase [Cognatishimia sp. F0-27]MCC1491063.1 alpha/beta hydrolase [Cognatishimia sp. F0-27]